MMKTYNLPTLSFSRLALFDRSPYQYHKKYILGEEVEKDTTVLDIGSAVDCLITQPDDFHNLFVVSTVKEPTAMMGDYVKYLFKYYVYFSQEYPMPDLEGIDIMGMAEEKAYQEAGFKISKEAVKERFVKEGAEYFRFLLKSQGKITIGFENFTKAQQAANILKTNKFTSKYLSETLVGNKERFYQLEDEFTFDGVSYRSKLDCVIVDHDEKTIQPLDIKTTGDSPYAFVKSMHRFRYDLQAVIYTHYISTKFIVDKNLTGYTILPFKFIVINVEYPNNPLIFRFSDTDFMAAKLGLKAGYNIRGIWDIMDDLEWHISNDLWEYKREVYEADGEIMTNMYDKRKTQEE